MKTKLLILVFILSGIGIYARSSTETSFVITNHDTTICNKVLMGFSEAKLELTNGSTMNVSKNEILAYKSNGKYFEKKEIYLNNKATGINAFMELISTRNGLRLFCYRLSDGGVSVLENNAVSTKDPVLLLIYKGNDFYLQLTKKNTPALLDFFHVDGAIFD